jgi:hypothetical protein
MRNLPALGWVQPTQSWEHFTLGGANPLSCKNKKFFSFSKAHLLPHMTDRQKYVGVPATLRNRTVLLTTVLNRIHPPGWNKLLHYFQAVH